MPCIQHKYHAQPAKTNGSGQGQLPPHVALQIQGPVLPIQINLHTTLAGQLQAKGAKMPIPISGQAMLDTGASHTCIDVSIPTQLGINPTGAANMATPSGSKNQSNLFPISIFFPGIGMAFNVNQALGAQLQQQGIIALIGRDFLSNCSFIYNGFTGEITLCI